MGFRAATSARISRTSLVAGTGSGVLPYSKPDRFDHGCFFLTPMPTDMMVLGFGRIGRTTCGDGFQANTDSTCYRRPSATKYGSLRSEKTDPSDRGRDSHVRLFLQRCSASLSCSRLVAPFIEMEIRVWRLAHLRLSRRKAELIKPGEVVICFAARPKRRTP